MLYAYVVCEARRTVLHAVHARLHARGHTRGWHRTDELRHSKGANAQHVFSKMVGAGNTCSIRTRGQAHAALRRCVTDYTRPGNIIIIAASWQRGWTGRNKISSHNSDRLGLRIAARDHQIGGGSVLQSWRIQSTLGRWYPARALTRLCAVGGFAQLCDRRSGVQRALLHWIRAQNKLHGGLRGQEGAYEDTFECPANFPAAVGRKRWAGAGSSELRGDGPG